MPYPHIEAQRGYYTRRGEWIRTDLKIAREEPHIVRLRSWLAPGAVLSLSGRPVGVVLYVGNDGVLVDSEGEQGERWFYWKDFDDLRKEDWRRFEDEVEAACSSPEMLAACRRWIAEHRDGEPPKGAIASQWASGPVDEGVTVFLWPEGTVVIGVPESEEG